MIKPDYNLKNCRALKGYFMSTINPPGSIGYSDASLLNSFDQSESGSSFRIEDCGRSDQFSPVSQFTGGSSFFVEKGNEAVKVVI